MNSGRLQLGANDDEGFVAPACTPNPVGANVGQDGAKWLVRAHREAEIGAP